MEPVNRPYAEAADDRRHLQNAGLDEAQRSLHSILRMSILPRAALTCWRPARNKARAVGEAGACPACPPRQPRVTNQLFGLLNPNVAVPH